MSEPCVTLADAKSHLRVIGAAEDEAVLLYLQLAQDLVTDRLERATTDSVVLGMISGWTDETTPAGIKAAILVQCAELYRFRGDEETTPKSDGRLSERVERFLGSWLERPFA